MIRGPPREREWLSWCIATAWAVVILITIPFARAVTDFVGARWGRAIFRDGVAMLVVAGVGAVVLVALRLKNLQRRQLLWLLLIGSGLAYCTMGIRASPEETLHFVQYFALGFLVFRALSHRTRDIGIYATAALLCSIVGLIDEALQWATPERVFDLRDVGFNALGGVMSQLAIWQGFSPSYIQPRVQPGTVRRICLYTATLVALLWLCLANTPTMTTRLVCRFPRLWYLLYKSNAMSEFGYRHDIAGIGTFFSRFQLDELQRLDRRRAPEAARVLNEYYDPRKYGKFLRTYTPLTDPFLHEARVHLFRRDHYLSVAPKYEANPKMKAYHYTVAWREHLFVKTFLPETLARSHYRWREDVEAAVRQKSDPSLRYVSDVSANLITSFSLRTVHAMGSVTMLILIGIWGATWKWEHHQRMAEP